MIDLHLHTTASDGLLSPAALVERARRAGLRTIAVTDHDTTAGLAEAAAAGASLGVRVVPGIEITSVVAGADIHLLAYFVDPSDATLAALLARQRLLRLERVREMADRLASHKCPIDLDAILAPLERAPERSVGRPAVARALVAAGHVPDVPSAFERWLGDGRPGWVPRPGPPPRQVVDAVRSAGGLVSVAHPGLSRVDALIPGWVHDGVEALEVFHPEHGPDAVTRYRALARRLGVLLTGGSDFHGDGPPGARAVIGTCTLPTPEFERVAEHAARAERGRAS